MLYLYQILYGGKAYLEYSKDVITNLSKGHISKSNFEAIIHHHCRILTKIYNETPIKLIMDHCEGLIKSMNLKNELLNLIYIHIGQSRLSTVERSFHFNLTYTFNFQKS